MQTVLIVVHLMIVLGLVGIVLIQRSEGGGLGIGGGSGFMSARGAANALTRTTAILALLFFVTSLGLGILARYDSKPTDILNRIPASGTNGVLDSLGGELPVTKPADKNAIPAVGDNTQANPLTPATGQTTTTEPPPAAQTTNGQAAPVPATGQ